MFIRTVIRQGNKILEQMNIIKQYKEENQGLRNEVDFRELQNNRNKRILRQVLKYFDALDNVDHWNNDENFKRMTRNSLKNEARELIKKELADCESN